MIDLDQVTGNKLTVSAAVGWNDAAINGTFLSLGAQTSVILK